MMKFLTLFQKSSAANKKEEVETMIESIISKPHWEVKNNFRFTRKPYIRAVQSVGPSPAEKRAWSNANLISQDLPNHQRSKVDHSICSLVNPDI